MFSDPLHDRAGAVAERLCSYFKQADAGSTISLAAFVISGEAGEDYVDQLLAAHRRGVHVQVVMDGWQVEKPPAARLISTLGTDTSAGSWVTVCAHASPEGNTSSCQGTKGMHNKFALFSSVSGREDVVVQSSANVTDVNHVSYWNNAVTVTGDRGLYRAYREYHADLVRMEQDPDYHRTVRSRGPAGVSVARFFPAATADPVEERLSLLGCVPGRTRVALGMSEWDDTRIGVAHEIARLEHTGCDVTVVAGPVGEQVAAALDSAGVPRKTLEDVEATGRLHSKYLVVSGARDAGPAHARGGAASFVLTGSHNYNTTSLRRNDEAILELHHQPAVNQYLDNARRLWEVALEKR
ncbi:phospholipase D-like domain-containing protein [Isoptericola cucumis]|uniref:phospholipase D-like domain-containing protein n=1 Tax=Isoptericola cucumis TaxID=1776856 RepID=UPI001664264F|nr:phospholipase D-like domain-containing protein [Isoptericola cucumis]